ncbi:pilin [Vibrio misgurnus]|uniref:pilin n=1 Tax=Vibrio misgurnus TaxID=2993714 RepID=UPI0023FA167E|nr:prepilin-type N-terminal cleavage/methylation domain-containing protein [Vibrio sp. VCS]
MKAYNKLQQGFTLIELMIVVAIIGILSAIAVPAYKSYVTKSELATGVSTLRSLLTNIDMHQQEKGTYAGITLADVGADKDMSGLGEIKLGTATVDSLILNFEFGANSSVEKAVMTYTKAANNGWKCEITKNTASAVTSDTAPKACSTIK